MAQKKKEENIEDRNYIKVSIFKDEYEKVGVSETDTLKTAVTKVREELDLPERFKLGGSKKTLIRNALKDASDKQVEKALAELTPEED